MAPCGRQDCLQSPPVSEHELRAAGPRIGSRCAGGRVFKSAILDQSRNRRYPRSPVRSRQTAARVRGDWPRRGQQAVHERLADVLMYEHVAVVSDNARDGKLALELELKYLLTSGRLVRSSGATRQATHGRGTPESGAASKIDRLRWTRIIIMAEDAIDQAEHDKSLASVWACRGMQFRARDACPAAFGAIRAVSNTTTCL